MKKQNKSVFVKSDGLKQGQVVVAFGKKNIGKSIYNKSRRNK